MYQLTDAEFEQFKEICQRMLGIRLCESKRSLIISRLSTRLKTLNLKTFQEYINFLASAKSGDELTTFVNKITTNETYFFREGKHFEYLEKVIVPAWVLKYQENKKPIRIWSAASSTGEEPYSIIMTIVNATRGKNFDFKLLGSDINTDVLKKAQEGIYSKTSVHKYMNEKLINRFFNESGADHYRIKDEIKRFANYKRINLQMERYPFKDKLDLIFCRNVMIYFDGETKERLVNRFYDHLNEGGYLIMGQSENLFSYDHKFKSVGNTVYQKVSK